MRATAQDKDASRLMGIDVNKTITFTFAIAGAAAGAAGIMWAQTTGTVAYNLGFQLGLIAFTSAVLGGVGNLYGAVLGGGQEYFGNYGVAHQDLVKFHRERIEVLVSANPDLFACETIPDLDEVSALLEVLSAYPDIPAWITMSCKDGEHTCAGQDISGLAKAVANHPNIVAIGVNCTKPEFVTPLFEKLAKVSELPLVVYPNAGRVWDGEARCWIGEGHSTLPIQIVKEWAQLGAKLIGGCCGLGPAAVTALNQDLANLR
jgi:homocysteine S-methyltransferase